MLPLDDDDEGMVTLDGGALSLESLTASKSQRKTISDILSEVGFGRFHVVLLVVCGSGWLTDTMWIQVLALVLTLILALMVQVVSTVLPALRAEFGLSLVSMSLLPLCLLGGSAIGAPVWGSISDRFGRTQSFSWTMLLSAVAGSLLVFAPNAVVVGVLLVLIGFGIGGNLPIDGALFSEVTPKEIRGRLTVAMSLFWVLGSMVSNGIAALLLPGHSCVLESAAPCRPADNLGWRYFAALVAVLNFLFVLTRHYMPESPYFLLKCGRPGEALAVLRTIARWNGTTFSESYRLVVEKVDDDIVAKRGFREALARLLSRSLRRTSLCLLLCWFAINFGFFGFNMFLPQVLAMKGVDMDSLYVDVFLYTAAGLPGAVVGAVLIESRFGRKWTLSLATLSTGVSMLLFVLTHTRLEWLVFQCVVSALSQVMWAALFTFTPELFPTEIRTFAVGICAGAGKSVGLFSPLFGFLLQTSHNTLPPLLIAAVALMVGAVAVCFIPKETRSVSLDDVDDSADLNS